jgi:PAS domain S-box-containing protein
MKILSLLQNFGVDENRADYVNRKIGISNIVAFFIFVFVAIPFLLITIFYTPDLISIPIAGLVGMILVLVLNRISLFNVARFLSAVIPLFLTAIFTSNIINGNEELPLGLFLIMLPFSIIPFLVFDFRERSYLIISAIFNFLIFLGVKYFPFVWVEQLEIGFITEGVLFEVSYIVSIVYVYLVVFTLTYINFNSELISQRLIDDNEKQTKELHDSEDRIKKNLAEVKKAQEEEKNRAWVTEGLGRINNLTRQHDDPEALSNEVISEIVKYVEANQGAIYLVEKDEEKDETYMEMKAAFAFGRKKAIKDRVKPGEGLIGQCYLEKDMIFLTEVPDDFIKIKSGLGDAPPKNVVIMPLMTNEKIEGILEIASFKILPDYKIDYLKKLGESLATSFSMNKINANTKRLLELSQEQEEQMRSQAEELHQNMEELQATQEEMERKNKETVEQNEQLQQQEEELRQNMEELSAQSDEMERQMKDMEKMQSEMKAREDILNETTVVSEADVYGTITYVNQKLIDVAKYKREEMIGKGHNLFRHPDMPAEIYKLMWEKIKGGKVFRGIIKNKAKDDSVYWVDATISPVLNADGKPEKYIGVRYVIEQEDVAQKLFEEQLERLGLSS